MQNGSYCMHLPLMLPIRGTNEDHLFMQKKAVYFLQNIPISVSLIGLVESGQEISSALLLLVSIYYLLNA